MHSIDCGGDEADEGGAVCVAFGLYIKLARGDERQESPPPAVHSVVARPTSTPSPSPNLMSGLFLCPSVSQSVNSSPDSTFDYDRSGVLFYYYFRRHTYLAKCTCIKKSVDFDLTPGVRSVWPAPGPK